MRLHFPLLRLLSVVVISLAVLTACDSGEDEETPGVTPPSVPQAVVGLLVTTPDGEGVGDLAASLQYEFTNPDAEGDRSTGARVGVTVLSVAYPNPFATAAILSLDVSAPGLLRIEAADLEGRPLATIAEREFATGTYQVVWEPSADAFPDGVYAVRLVEGGVVVGSRHVLRLTEFDPNSGGLVPATVALGTTDAEGTLAFNERARLPQLYDAEVEYRSVNNDLLGVLAPSDSVTIILRDGAGREQRYERSLDGETNGFDLTWDPE